MLISMPTGASMILGAFHLIFRLQEGMVMVAPVWHSILAPSSNSPTRLMQAIQ
jgi:hypothetical protein